MATLTDLQKWRDRLIEAMADPTRAVQDSDGSRIEYKSTREIVAAINAVNRAIQLSEAGRSRVAYPTFDKGI